MSQAPEGLVVYFKFDQMDIFHHWSCRYDYVNIYDGADENSPLMGRFCGNRVPSKTFQSRGTDMLVVFVSYEMLTATGFIAFYDFDIGRIWEPGNVSLV